MKYWFIVYEFRDGEHEYTSKGVIETDDEANPIKEFERLHLSDMWGDETTQEDGVFWSPTGEVCVKVSGCREISKRDFNVLAKYHSAHHYKPEPEKVNFT